MTTLHRCHSTDEMGVLPTCVSVNASEQGVGGDFSC